MRDVIDQPKEDQPEKIQGLALFKNLLAEVADEQNANSVHKGPFGTEYLGDGAGYNEYGYDKGAPLD